MCLRSFDATPLLLKEENEIFVIKTRQYVVSADIANDGASVPAAKILPGFSARPKGVFDHGTKS